MHKQRHSKLYHSPDRQDSEFEKRESVVREESCFFDSKIRKLLPFRCHSKKKFSWRSEIRGVTGFQIATKVRVSQRKDPLTKRRARNQVLKGETIGALTQSSFSLTANYFRCPSSMKNFGSFGSFWKRSPLLVVSDHLPSPFDHRSLIKSLQHSEKTFPQDIVQ